MINETLKNANILIVDDQQDNIDILTGLLDIKGFTNYRSITDSRKVIELFKELKPDLLLLDLQMPYLTGFQVMAQLKEIITPETYFPILVLTADISMESRQKALSGGAADFLTKPFDLVEVDLRIKNLLHSKFLHSKLANQNKYLDQLVRERTKELEKTNIELIAAKEVAEEMNKIKSFFLSNISHEMRTPLISILGFSEILLSELKNTPNFELAEYIHAGGVRLSATFDSIVALHSLEKDKQKVESKKVGLSKFITEIHESLKLRAVQKGLLFKLNISREELLLYTDPELLQKTLFNILDNSFKFTKSGEISIQVSYAAAAENHFAIINITDTGIGIEPEKIKNIFSPFRQASEGLSRSHEGMGLGLTIAKQLIELLGGELTINSEVGKGTTVTIKLQTAHHKEWLAEKVKQRKRTIIIEPVAANTGKKEILLVEDNPGNRILFTKYLKKDFEVEEAEDGVCGIAKAGLMKYDLILMDINLGDGIDGIETMNEIRKIKGYTQTPIIAVTAFAMRGDRENFIDKGFNDYLQKPFLKDELTAIVKKNLKITEENKNNPN